MAAASAQPQPTLIQSVQHHMILLRFYHDCSGPCLTFVLWLFVQMDIKTKQELGN